MTKLTISPKSKEFTARQRWANPDVADETIPKRKNIRSHQSVLREKEHRGHSISLIEAIREASPEVTVYLATLLLAKERIEMNAKPFKLFSKVAFRWQGRGNYLSNYCMGYVIDAQREFVILLGINGQVLYTMEKRIFTKDALTVEKFEALREKLISKNALWDPHLTTTNKTLLMKALAPGEKIPTMESALTIAAPAVKKRVSKADLADLTANIMQTGSAKGVVPKGKRSRFDGTDVLSFQG